MAPRWTYGYSSAVTGGFFYVAGGVAVLAPGGDRGGVIEAQSCAGTLDVLHVASGACGIGEHLYVVVNHGVELTFLRLSGGRGACGWVPLKAALLPRGSVLLSTALRISLTVVGGDRMAAVVNMTLVKVHVAGDGAVAMEGLVLVYDIAGGKWSRAPDLPP